MVAYEKTWVLDIKEEKRTFYKTPSFWFPSYQDSDTVAVFGKASSDPVLAEIWGTPLSRCAGDNKAVERKWRKLVAEPLTETGWRSYGEATKKPSDDWGVQLPVTLDQRKVAKWIKNGDSGQALAPLEKAVEDFVSVVPAINELVKQVRKSKLQPKKKRK